MKWTAFESRIKLQKSRNSLAEVSHTNGDLRGGGERLVQAIDMYRKFKCSTKIRNNKRGRKLIDQEFHTRQVLGKSHTQIWGNPTHRFGEIPHTDSSIQHWISVANKIYITKLLFIQTRIDSFNKIVKGLTQVTILLFPKTAHKISMDKNK